MTIKPITTSKQATENVSKLLQTQKFKSRFRFLNDHNGFRTSELHTIIGPKGGSKSTLVRSVLCELIMAGAKVHVLLSEETPSMWSQPVREMVTDFFNGDTDQSNSFLRNCFVDSELNWDHNNSGNLHFLETYLHEVIRSNEIDCLVYDNATTGTVSAMSFNDQQKAIHLFKRVASQYGIPVIVVLHTAKNVDTKTRIMNGDDVRGNATWVNLASYNYLLQVFFDLKPIRGFLFNEKARYHSAAHNSIYELRYEPEWKIYIEDRRSSIDELYSAIEQVKQLHKGKK